VLDLDSHKINIDLDIFINLKKITNKLPISNLRIKLCNKMENLNIACNNIP
jgi:hypothetical protein